MPASLGAAISGLVAALKFRNLKLAALILLTLIASWGLAGLITRLDPAQAVLWIMD